MNKTIPMFQSLAGKVITQHDVGHLHERIVVKTLEGRVVYAGPERREHVRYRLD